MALFYDESGRDVPTGKYILGIPALVLIICGILAIVGVISVA
jgi:hypothetical protein